MAAAVTPESIRSTVPIVAGDSSPLPSPASSAESNFRELDEAFLQKQTRIWLGEVLQIRFDEKLDVTDLLSDGELLFEVSEVISRMLPTLVVDTTQPKLNEWKSLASNKSTKRYMPYYNVGAFLRLCKNLGLDSIDLFTPSDVVEKRNTRKVCICLRSLSKKVRSGALNVPDFDSVTCTLAMPTNMVQYIRQSLERSQSSSPLSVEKDSVSRFKYWQRMSNSASPLSNVYSDNSVDAESSLMVLDSLGSTNHTCDAAPIILGQELAREDESEQKLELDMDHERDVEGEYLSPTESVSSPCSEYCSDQELSNIQSMCLDSLIGSKVCDSMGRREYQNIDVNHVPIDLADNPWDIQNYRDGRASNDEIDDFHDEAVKGEIGFNTCDKLNNVHVENFAGPSEIERESTSCDDIEPVCCTNSFAVGDRGLNVPSGNAVEDDLCADEAPILVSESFEDEPLASNNYITNSYSNDLCVVDNDFVTDETPLSKFKGLDEQMEVKEEPFYNKLISDICESHFDEKGNPNDLSVESLNHPTKAINDGVNSCHHLLNYDVLGKVKLHKEQCLWKVDSSEQSFHCSCPVAVQSSAVVDLWPSPRFAKECCSPLHLLPDIDAIISANVHHSPMKNENEAFDANVITSEHTGGCFDNNSISSVDLSPFPTMIVNKDSIKWPDEVLQGTRNQHEDHNVVPKIIEIKPINIEDYQVGYEDLNVLDLNVIGNDKCISIGDANYVNSSIATIENPQLRANSPRSEDSGNKHNQCVETLDKGESKNVVVEDNKKIQMHKPHRTLLKSVVKGTAIVGIAVFLLRFRYKTGRMLSLVNWRESNHILKQSLRNLLSLPPKRL